MYTLQELKDKLIGKKVGNKSILDVNYEGNKSIRLELGNNTIACVLNENIGILLEKVK